MINNLVRGGSQDQIVFGGLQICPETKYANKTFVDGQIKRRRVGKNDGKWEEKYQGNKHYFCTQTVLGRNFLNIMLFLMRKNGAKPISTS